MMNIYEEKYHQFLNVVALKNVRIVCLSGLLAVSVPDEVVALINVRIVCLSGLLAVSVPDEGYY